MSHSTEGKALEVNLDPSYFGTFAEIGAGQETARYFFKVGGAAGTIAKSMSAYDMTFSDSIYGKVGRYVSRERLSKMLEHEYQLLLTRLSEKRGVDTKFFVFANTVAAKSYQGTGESHGWLGVRFQTAPHSPASDIVIHIRMLDGENLLQQQALGIVGVNLIYAAFYLRSDPKRFIDTLVEGAPGRIEIDMIEFSGEAFAGIDNRVMSLFLLERGLTHAVMFGPDGRVLQPSEALYKRAVLVERGSFRPVTHVNIDMIQGAKGQFLRDIGQGADPLLLFEITLKNLMSAGTLDEHDFLARADCLSALGYTVLISNYSEYYRLSKFFRKNTKETIGMVLGVNALLEIFNNRFYENLEGGVLEALGKLFTNRARFYIYPMLRETYLSYLEDTPDAIRPVNISQLPPLINISDVIVPPHLRDLFAHVVHAKMMVPITQYEPSHLGISSWQVLEMIKSGDPAWKGCVPAAAAALIEDRKMFRAIATPAPVA